MPPRIATHRLPLGWGGARPRLTLAVDYHGVLNSYARGPYTEDNAVSAEPPTPGAIEWLLEASREFIVVVTTARFRDRPDLVPVVAEWLIRHGIPRDRLTLTEPPPENPHNLIWVARDRPRAWLVIDDRAWCFTGTFPTLDEVRAFRTWNRP